MIVLKSNILISSFRNRLQFSIPTNQFLLKKMSSKCKVAVVQFTATNNKIDNLNTVTKLIASAVNKNAKVKMMNLLFRNNYEELVLDSVFA